MSEIDKEFEEAAKKINAKIKEAAAALIDLAMLCEQSGLDSLIVTPYTRDWLGKTKTEALQAKLELINGVSALESAIDANGWSTSSSHC